MGIEHFRSQIEEVRELADTADDPAVERHYRHQAELLESVESMLSAQGKLVERKNDSLVALAELLLSFQQEHADAMEPAAREELDSIAGVARNVLDSVDQESSMDPLRD